MSKIQNKDKDLERVLHIVNVRLSQLSFSPLNKIETEIIKGIWGDRTYNNIALEHNYSNAYITNIAAPSLFKKLSCLVSIKIRKNNCKKLLEKYCLVLEEKPLFPAGAISLESRFYVKRHDPEEKIYAEMEKPGALVRIRAPQEMGKTSLMLRLVNRAKQLGYQTVYLDLHELDIEIFDTCNKFLRYFCATIVRELGLESKLDEYWDDDLGCKTSCNSYFQEYLLQSINSPLFLAIDEVDRVFEYPKIAKDFFSLLRLWHEKSKMNLVWQKLRLAISYSTEIHVPLQVKQSPFNAAFNVGLPVQLGYFSCQEVIELAKCYGFSWQIDGEEVNLLIKMVGGHPALVHLAIYHLSQENITLPELLKIGCTATGIYANHLSRHQENICQNPGLAIALHKVVSVNEPVLLEPSQAHQLKNMGLIKLHQNQAVISCQLYGDYFRQTFQALAS
ncbi:MAG: serine/threonine protein kinase [Oscillatoria sp. SIO1A7]|nr:serine/threonine protein kinase [Oscillatoria sp. SIO1A7]